MIEIRQLKVDDKAIIGLKMDLPDSPPLVAIIGERGFVMCGFLNIEAAEKLDAVAAMVSGVRTVDEVLEAKVKAVTSKARNLGINPGLKGREVIKLLS